MLNFLSKLARPVVNLTVNSSYKLSDLVFGRKTGNSGYETANLSAVFCAFSTFEGALTSIPRIAQRIDASTGLPTRNLFPSRDNLAKLWMGQANPEQSSGEMLKLIIHDLLADGNFYAIPKRNQLSGRVESYTYVHYSRVPRGNIFYSNGNEQLSSGRKSVKGELLVRITVDPSDTKRDTSYLLPHSDIIHMKGLVPDRENFRSQGVIEHAQRTFDFYNAAEKSSTDFYTKGWRNQMFLSTENKLAPDARKRMEDLFKTSKSKDFTIDEILDTRILEQGLKPVHVGLPLEQMEFVKSKAFAIEDIARWFNMPPVLLHSYMGGSKPDSLEASVSLWIQMGLGHFMNNLCQQFKEAFLPSSSVTSYSLGFSRIHLYQTLLNDFSQAMRNFFEIGAIDRRVLCSLTGAPLDMDDELNTQRYVPANLITANHSLTLQEKAEVSIDVMKKNMEKMDKDLSAPDKPENPPVAEEEKDDNPDQSASDENLDNRIVANALLASLKGFNQHAIRVCNSKKTKGEHAVVDWSEKFFDFLETNLQEWQPVLNHFGFNIPDLIESWVDQLIINSDELPSWLDNYFSSMDTNK